MMLQGRRKHGDDNNDCAEHDQCRGDSHETIISARTHVILLCLLARANLQYLGNLCKRLAFAMNVLRKRTVLPKRFQIALTERAQ